MLETVTTAPPNVTLETVIIRKEGEGDILILKDFYTEGPVKIMFQSIFFVFVFILFPVLLCLGSVLFLFLVIFS